MADVKFTDSYVQMQRARGNTGIFAWRTPTGEVYYGPSPRSAQPQATTSVGRVSQALDTTVAEDPTTPTEDPTTGKVATLVPRADKEGGDRILGKAVARPDTEPMDLSGIFGGDADATPEEVAAGYEQYIKDRESLEGIWGKEGWFSTKLGKAAAAAAPVTSVAVAGAASIVPWFRSKSYESKSGITMTEKMLAGEEAIAEAADPGSYTFLDKLEADIEAYTPPTTPTAPTTTKDKKEKKETKDFGKEKDPGGGTEGSPF